MVALIEKKNLKERFEWLELFSVANKGADSACTDPSDDAARCEDILNRLKTTPLEVILNTDTGKRLSFLTAHKSPEISSSARDLLDIWLRTIYARGRVIKETKNGVSCAQSKLHEINPAKSSKKKLENNQSGLVLALASPRGFKTSKGRVLNGTKKEVSCAQSKLHEINQAKSSRKKLEYSKTRPGLLSALRSARGFKASRLKIREILFEAFVRFNLRKDERVLNFNPHKIGASLETSMFARLGFFAGSQKVKCKSILKNIWYPLGEELRAKLVLGEIEGDDLIRMFTREPKKCRGR